VEAASTGEQDFSFVYVCCWSVLTGFLGWYSGNQTGNKENLEEANKALKDAYANLEVVRGQLKGQKGLLFQAETSLKTEKSLALQLQEKVNELERAIKVEEVFTKEVSGIRRIRDYVRSPPRDKTSKLQELELLLAAEKESTMIMQEKMALVASSGQEEASRLAQAEAEAAAVARRAEEQRVVAEASGAKLAEAKGQLKDQEALCADLQGKLDGVTTELQEQTSKVGSLQAEAQKFKEQMETMNSSEESEKSALLEKISTLNGNLKAIEGTQGELTAKVSSLLAENASLVTDKSAAETEVASLKTELDNTLKDFKNFKISMSSDMDTKVGTLESEVASLAAAAEELRQRKDSLEAEAQGWEVQRKEMEAGRSKLQASLNLANEKVEVMVGDLKKKSSEAAEAKVLQEQKQKLEKTLLDSQTQAKAAEEKGAQLQASLDTLTKEQALLSSKSTEEVEKLEGELSDARAEMEAQVSKAEYMAQLHQRQLDELRSQVAGDGSSVVFTKEAVDEFDVRQLVGLKAYFKFKERNVSFSTKAEMDVDWATAKSEVKEMQEAGKGPEGIFAEYCLLAADLLREGDMSPISGEDSRRSLSMALGRASESQASVDFSDEANNAQDQENAGDAI